MFEKLRRPGRSPKEGRVKKIFSYIIFGAICLVFVFLAPMGTQLIGEGVLGYVGHEPLRAGELRLIEESLRRAYESRLEQADEEEYSQIQKEIRQRALQQLAQMYLLVQSAKKAGFYLSDQELRAEIQSFPAFQKNGRFLYSLYLSYLKSQRLSPTRFEERIRKSKLAENWVQFFQKATNGNELEKKKKLERQAYKVQLLYAELSAEEGEEFYDLVKAKDQKAITRLLKKRKMKWEDTKLFSLFSSFGIPISQNQNVMSAVIDHLPSQGLIPKIIPSGNKIYIVNVKSFKKTKASSKAKDQNLQNLMAMLNRNFDQMERLWSAWLDVQKEETKIRLSDQI